MPLSTKLQNGYIKILMFLRDKKKTQIDHLFYRLKCNPCFAVLMFAAIDLDHEDHRNVKY
jgi:hypothetical protein